MSKHREFEKENGVISSNGEIGYKSKSDANEYARLKCQWWGSNLVYLGAAEKNGLWFPGFNVWD